LKQLKGSTETQSTLVMVSVKGYKDNIAETLESKVANAEISIERAE
jgi:hypothetical protein